MENNPLVSVIIPVYNAENYVYACLESVITQTYKPIEIIVIDDGSSDESTNIVKKFDVQLVEQPNSGACAARNLGIQKASGNFLQFLDADDLLSPEKIQIQVNKLVRNVNAVANGRWGRFYSEDPNTEAIQWGPDSSLQMDLSPVDWLLRNHMSQTGCWLVPSGLVKKAGFWDETLTINQDGEFFSRVVGVAEKVIYTPDAKVYYRSNITGSISSAVRRKKSIESLFKTCRSYEKILLDLEDSDRTHRAIANRFQYFLYKTYPHHTHLAKEAEKKIHYYGGSDIEPYRKGPAYNRLQKLLGWKFLARLDSVRKKINGKIFK